MAGVGEQVLYPPRSVGVGNEPYGIATSDLDGDGNPDLVVACIASSYAFVLFGRGDGFFDSTRLLADVNHGSVVIGDFNEDGVGDIALGSTGSVSVFLGTGDREFTPKTEFQSSGGAYDLASADFNGDGHTDLIGGTSNSVELLLGAGDGSFSSAAQYLPTSIGLSIVVGDFKEDGFQDFVSDGALWFGNGDGTFVNSGTGVGGLNDPVAYDFNEDQHLDIAVAHQAGVMIQFGNGQGEFSAPVQVDDSNTSALSLADMDRDGRQDLVAAKYTTLHVGPSVMTVLISNGDGTFEPAVDYLAPFTSGRLTSADFDRDGSVDIASSSLFGGVGTNPIAKGQLFTTPGIAFTMFGDGHGGLVSRRVALGGDTTRWSSSVAASDLDGDNEDDLAVIVSGDEVSVLLAEGDGSFLEQSVLTVGSGPRAIVAGQLDAGDVTDLVVANYDSSDLSVLIGNGDGTFGSASTISLGRAPRRLAAADLNGNGVLDLVTANPLTSDVSVLLGVGDGTFALPVTIEVEGSPTAVVIADLDGEHGLDIALSTVGAVSILPGNGDGTFGAESRLPAEVQGPIGAGDVDGDGDTDLVVGGFGESFSALVIYGNGEGGWSDSVPLDVTIGVGEIAIDDIDGDGRIDVILTHSLPMVTVIPGAEDGLGPPLEFTAGTNNGVAVGEFNRDGRMDLASTHSKGLAILLNQAPVLLKVGADKGSLTWPILVGYDRFNVYRGDLSSLPIYGGAAKAVCRTDQDPDATDNLFQDDEIPAVGNGFFYLMSRVRDGLESDLGQTSAGVDRSPDVPCP